MKTHEATKLVDDNLAKLANDLQDGQSQSLQGLLKTMAKFHDYSLGNILLILSQRPEATHVAGYRAWQSLGRHVNAGEKGIAILAPMSVKSAETESSMEADPERTIRFRVAYVFDISQTGGSDLPGLQEPSGEPGDYAERLKALVRQLDIELEYSDSLKGALGVSKGGSITIRQGMHPAQEFSVMVHELAHEILHQGDGREGSTKEQRELEAEAVAFVVAESIGIQMGKGSSDYIQLYKGDPEKLAASLSAVRRAASTILHGFQECSDV